MNPRKGCFRLLLVCVGVALLTMSLQPAATRYRQWNPGNNPDNLLGIQSWFIKVFAAAVSVIWALSITRPLGWVFLVVIILLLFSAFVYILRGFTDPLGTQIKKQQKQIRELKERMQKEAEGRAVPR